MQMINIQNISETLYINYIKSEIKIYRGKTHEELGQFGRYNVK